MLKPADISQLPPEPILVLGFVHWWQIQDRGSCCELHLFGLDRGLQLICQAQNEGAGLAAIAG
jgi:hypothetical protein